MSVESKEFVALREGEYARASLGVARPEAPERERDEEQEPPGTKWVCLDCGERKFLRAHMHVCQQCFEELEGEL